MMDKHFLINHPIGMSISCIFLLSFMLTGLVRKILLQKKILDIPNERSSHQTPIPRGGGLAIVIAFNLAILLFFYFGKITVNLFYALSIGGIIIAAVGYYDDIYKISTKVRICCHFIVAFWAVCWIGGFYTLDFGNFRLFLQWKGDLLAVISIVWCINLYNFMDGIDGLAGIEGFFISVVSTFAFLYLADFHLAWLSAILAASILGFTIWNWPPAKVFLGDVGSSFLGYIFAIFAIYTANQNILPISFWFILMAVFLCDATFTLIARIVSGKKWYQAHKEHAYQMLVNHGVSHQKVTFSILCLNLMFLLPLSWCAIYWPTQAFWFIFIATLLMFILWFSIKYSRMRDSL